MAIAIPASREQFLRQQQSSRADFAKRFFGGWEQYRAQILSDLEQAKRAAGRWGVTVVLDATLDGFAELLTINFDAVILFAHWAAGDVEFADGLATAGAVADRIPSAFSGVLDLCVCHPGDLVREVRAHRPNCTAKHLSFEAAPRFWFKFYEILFQELHRRDLTYMEAVAEVAGGFVDWARAHGGCQL